MIDVPFVNDQSGLLPLPYRYLVKSLIVRIVSLSYAQMERLTRLNAEDPIRTSTTSSDYTNHTEPHAWIVSFNNCELLPKHVLPLDMLRHLFFS